MVQFDTPTYVFDFRDKANCFKVRNAKKNVEICILVYATDDELGLPISAKGVLTEDNVFRISVATDAGEQTHEWTYDDFLTDAAKAHSIET